MVEKTFAELMKEYHEAYDKTLLEQAKMLQEAAKLAKTNAQKLDLPLALNTLDQKMGRTGGR